MHCELHSTGVSIQRNDLLLEEVVAESFPAFHAIEVNVDHATQMQISQNHQALSA